MTGLNKCREYPLQGRDQYLDEMLELPEWIR
jgi:hypothetical protein